MNIGLKVILMGVPGCGKTHALRTLIDSGLEVFGIITEPNAFNTIQNLDGASQAYKDAVNGNGKLHLQYIPPAKATWESMTKAAKMITTYDMASIGKMPAADKAQHTQFLSVLSTCADFKDGDKSYGPIDQFNPDTQAVFLDSLSGLNKMFLSHVCGTKPVKTLPEWGCAIDMEINFLEHLCFGIPCHVIVTAHLAREVDEVLGGIRTTVNALGRKAPQEIPKYFTDTILAKREGSDFTWSTADHGVDTKATTIKPSGKHPPTFLPLIETWRNRNLRSNTNVSI